MIDQSFLINLLKKEIHSQKNTISPLFEKEILKLEQDKTTISEMDENTINDLIKDLPISTKEKEEKKIFLFSMKRLVNLTKHKKAYFQMTNHQIKQIEEIINLWKKENNNQKQYQLLLSKIENPSNYEYIDNIDIIIDLFHKYELEDYEKRLILTRIMKYNKEIYESKKEVKENNASNNREDVEYILNTYGYYFDNLRKPEQQELLEKGNLKRIEEVLKELKKYNYPRFILPQESMKMKTILINSNKETIQKITEFGKEKNIFPQDLYRMTPALISNTSNIDSIARADDFKKNVEFLENLGYKISYILKKCKELLLLNNNKLVSNYQKYISYGLIVQTNKTGSLTNPSLTCLLSNHFAEIIDQFIETNPKGYRYVKENMDWMSNIKDSSDILFYNIYQASKTTNPYEKKNNKIQLIEEITQKNISYQGITEENKYKITNTIIIEYPHKQSFEEAINKSKEEDLYDLTIEDNRIEKLNRYIDPMNPLQYDFKGIIISRLKVKRIFNILKNYDLDDYEDSMLYAITYHSIMTKEDLDKIKRLLKEGD